MVQQQTTTAVPTKDHGGPEQQPKRPPMPHIKDVAPAWAIAHPDGSWELDWNVNGADHYQVVLEGAEGEAPRVVAKGPDLGSLQLPNIAKAHRLRVIARMGDDAYAVSKVGTGARDAKADVSEHLREWKSWKELAPPHPDGKTLLHTTTEPVWLGGWTTITTQRWRVVRTPQTLMTFRSAFGDLFPGAIVQSKTAIANGALTSAKVETEERVPLTPVITALNSGKISPVPPIYDAVYGAIKEAVAGRKCTSSDIRFSIAEAQTSEQTALSLNVSGKYGGFAASLNVESNRKENQNTVLAFLQQRAFTASVQIVSPEDLFSDKFTEERLARLKTLGTMDRDNPPLLVSDVIYGRIVAITITSKASESDLTAAAQASYNGFGAEVGTDVKDAHKETLAKSDIKVFAQGGDTEAIKAAMKDGALADYFGEEKNLEDFEPIGFVLKTLDDELATMSEHYEYETTSFS
ncbi:thiol-activated cytolysin family protein [Glycomyces tritici]|uniref:Thiol-activated cytolysin family protein n=1 Tax=Glycomyces tritici TaxID=2665176 RepID=A0ABT7YWZ2_9ACTN|nr:thiol-activated cytolysin family protein [Glycomyces tritici]MDN3243163.1 thiol-activated cytolysin family protein [Glycomyces tritici]